MKKNITNSKKTRLTIVLFSIIFSRNKNLPRDINLVYEQKLNLKQISDIVESEMQSSNSNLVLRKSQVKNYTGDATLFKETFPAEIFAGFQAGVARVCK